MTKNQTIGETKNWRYFTDNDTLQEQKHKKSGQKVSERGLYGIKKLYLIRIKSFAEKSDFTVFGIVFLYATHENKLIKQDAKNKKLSALEKIGFKELCGKCNKLYWLHIADYTQPVKAE